MTLPSYCSECDAPPGHCNHHTTRYLDPIQYEPVHDKRGKRVAWKVPDHERARWDNPPRTTKPATPTDTPKPIPQIITELEDWIVIDQRLHKALKTAHHQNPRTLTRLTDKLITDIRNGNITNPEGMLNYRLKQLPT